MLADKRSLVVILNVLGDARLPVKWVSRLLNCVNSIDPHIPPILRVGPSEAMTTVSTYEWKSAVAACRNLRFVRVDEDPGVASRATATITGHYLLVGPSDRLSMDELNRRSGLRLRSTLAVAAPAHGVENEAS